MSTKKEEVIFRSQTKLNGQLGLLFLSSNQLHWCAHGSNTPTVVLPFIEIKNQFVSTAASQKVLLKIITDETPGALSLVFEFTHPTTSRNDLNVFREAIAQVLPKKTADSPAKPPPPTISGKKPAPPKPVHVPLQFGKLTEEDVMKRVALLQGNKDVQSMHEKLVKGGVITEEDFWESRQALMENEAKKQNHQQVGMSSALITDVRPTSETCNAVHYKLTPQIIHQIFVHFPVVHRAYQDNVPTKLTEQEFWVKYFQSQFFHRDRLKGPAGSGDELFAKYATEADREKDPVILKHNLTKVVDPTIDLSADSDTALPDGYGLAQEESLRPIKLTKSLPILRMLNNHARTVLNSTDLLNTPLQKTAPLAKDKMTHDEYTSKIRDHIEIPDLAADKNPDTVPLKIQDVRRYFDAHSTSKPDQQPSFSPQLLVDTFNSELSNWSLDLSKAVLQPALAMQITSIELHNLTQVKSTSSGGDIMKELELTNEFQQELLATFDMSNQLLRHFWSNIPHTFPALPLTPKQAEKIKPVTKSISSLYDELQHRKNNLPDDKKSKWGSLFLPIMQSLNKAVEKYHDILGKA